MTQSNLLELAKQGDPQAIATLMNRSLQPKGMTASVGLQGDRLKVLLESAQIPNRQAMIAFVRNGITSLGLQSIQSIEIASRQVGNPSPVWTEEIFLKPPTTPVPPDLESASVPTTSIQPPVSRRPAAPPPPPPPRRVPPAEPVSPPPVAADRIGNGAAPVEPRATVEPVVVEDLADLEESPLVNEPAVINEPAVVEEETLAPDPVIYSGSGTGDRLDDQPASVVTPAHDEVNFTPDESLEYVAYEEPNIPPVDAEPTAPAEQLTWTDADGVEHAVDAPVPERPTRTGRSPWFYLILLVVASWIAAIVGFSIWYSRQERSLQPSASEIAPDPAAELDADEDKIEQPLSENPLEDAASRAEQAETLAETARSADDWGLVVSQWEQAIALLQAVPADSPDYATARNRLPAYQQSLAAAQQQAANLPANTNASAPTSSITVSNQVTCREVESTPESDPVQLTNVQFDPEASENGGNFVVGCVTNHSDQTVSDVSVSYRGGSAENPNLFQGGYSSLGVAALEPGETVPFRSSFTINPDVTTVNVEAVFWTPEGASEPQRIEAPVTLDRSSSGTRPARPQASPTRPADSPTTSPQASPTRPAGSPTTEPQASPTRPAGSPPASPNSAGSN
ncbi:hypothetical protein H6F95_14850 [Cyanobacteria bacterium FACHB-471]|nr:hypothetical protein [Cyanobacteria bacterium FACHB-471]